MIKFDPQNYPYPSKRNVVYARNGMCNAGNPHAASAGLQTLLKGGNAVDAAVAMASAMPVVEHRPRCVWTDRDNFEDQI